MRIVTWNMGSNIPASSYRKHHDEAWRYLIEVLRPDVALVQEAVLSKIHGAQNFSATMCDLPPQIDAGTAVLVRRELITSTSSKITVSETTYVATVKLDTSDGPLNIASVHVYPDERQQLVDLAKLVELLSTNFADEPVLVGGDFNAARHFDKVYGRKIYQPFFDAMAAAGFHDVHWGIHEREVQSFWGRQAKEPYQDDHFFVSKSWAPGVLSCEIKDNEIVRRVSDHGPVVLELNDAGK